MLSALCIALVCLHLYVADAALPYCGWIPGTPPPPLVPPLDPSVAAQVQLRQVQAVIRHGDRTQAGPDMCWPNDQARFECDLTYAEVPNNEPAAAQAAVSRLYRKVYQEDREVKPGNCAVGQLTSRGYKQQIEHGAQLRDAYINQAGLLPLTLEDALPEMFIWSDDVPRTVQSAHSLMLGLFPDNATRRGSGARGGATVTVPLVNVYTEDIQKTIMFPNANICPQLATYKQEATQSPAFVQYMQTTGAAIIAAFNAATNQTVTDFAHIPDCVWTHVCHDLEVPAGITPDLVEQIQDAASWLQYYLYAYPNRTAGAQVGMGPLLAHIGSHMTLATTNSTFKFMLYSGHDDTVMPLLTALGAADKAWSPLASLVAFELYEYTARPGTFAVRMVFNGVVVHAVDCNYGGGDLCDLSQFVDSVLAPVIPTPDQCPGAQLKRVFHH